jgi:hypothetical protein
MDWTDIYIIFHPTSAEYTLFQVAHDIVYKIDILEHMLVLK